MRVGACDVEEKVFGCSEMGKIGCRFSVLDWFFSSLLSFVVAKTSSCIFGKSRTRSRL